MNKLFVRNFFLFAVLLLTSTLVLSYILIIGEKEMEKSESWITYSYRVISESEQLSTQIESMIAAQRGYLLTGDEEFFDRYKRRKALVNESLDILLALSEASSENYKKFTQMKSLLEIYSDRLEEPFVMVSGSIMPDPSFRELTDVEELDTIKSKVRDLSREILEAQYSTLNSRLGQLEQKKDDYFSILLGGLFTSATLLFLFNAFLLRAQSRRGLVEKSLRSSEERFSLAVEGTNDGIFDWNLKTGSVFYSRQFFRMLGYDRGPLTGTVRDGKELVHPDDVPHVDEALNNYLEGRTSEYDVEFRMKHATGQWFWINSKAKAVFDEKGEPLRMVGAHTDIHFLRQKQEQLKLEKQKAEKANEAKSQFLAHMSHEIRTPLTAISGIAEIFERNDANLDIKQKKLLSTLVSSTAVLKDLVNDILDFSKIESGLLELEEELVSLKIFFASIVSMMAVKANEKNIAFSFEYSDVSNIAFMCDEARLRQILVNLISNAIKFTDEGQVNVIATLHKEKKTQFLRIDIEDTGIGIASENFDIVFERFRQGDSSISRKYGGTGLGLPISRNLATLMGGEIRLNSELGKGSQFTLLLPIKEMTVIGDAETSGKKKTKSSKSEKPLKGGKNIKDASNDIRILIVEDYDGNVVFLQFIMEDMGIPCDVAGNGVEGLKMWEEGNYDLILMDVQMPKMDGFTATGKIRKIEKKKKLSHTPIIGMTAHALEGDRQRCLDAGMDSYVPKPIVSKTLQKEIRKMLSAKKH